MERGQYTDESTHNAAIESEPCQIMSDTNGLI